MAWFSVVSLYMYLHSAFTEKPYSKPLERNVVYTSKITSSHATSHDVKLRQNKPWFSTILLAVRDVMASMTLFRC